MVILIAGKRGSGKTTDAKKLAKPFKNQFILDLYNEYEGQIFNSFNIPKTGIRRVREAAADNEHFFKYLSSLTNNLIILEDATIIFNASIYDRDLKKLIIASRHKQNTIIFLFHSLNRIPTFLIEQANILILHKTNETQNTFYKLGNTEIENAFKFVNKQKSPYASKILKL